MFAALGKSFAQMFEPALRRALAKTLLLTLAVLVALWVGVGAALDAITFSESAWLDRVVAWLGGALAVIVTLVLFAPLATLVASLFQDEVAAAVEARHYPDLPPAAPQTIGQSVIAGVRLVVWSLAVNLLCLPLYVLLPVVNIVIFFAINGILLAREYFEVVALRRMARHAAGALRRRHRVRLWLAGVVVAVLFWVPVVNLAAPILGTALLVHVVEGCRRREAA
jgi:uncharacterized protein involved in cysteine biosynthesis